MPFAFHFLMRRASLMARTLLPLAIAGTAMQAQAVPSYSRQTGSDCAACHVGAFGPQLTPYGMRFKIGGYTDSDGKEGKIPLSAMVVAGFTRTGQPDTGSRDGLKPNNNLEVAETSVFLAGRMSDNLGTFVQWTRDGVGRRNALDQVDVRFAKAMSIGSKDMTLGLSINNNPSVQDPFNTLPVWGFPYTDSPAGYGMGDYAPKSEGLGQHVLGISAYTLFDKNWYAELGTYHSLSPVLAHHLGADPAEDPGKLSGGNIYWRFAYTMDAKKYAYSAGLFGMRGSLHDRTDPTAPRDHFSDVGIDGSFQMLGNREHVVTVNGSWMREKGRFDAGFAASEWDDPSVTFNSTRLNVSYYCQQSFGATLGYFSNTGSADTHYTNGKPDTNGWLLQGDWTPFGKEASWMAPYANLRLGAQYWMYNKFNGAKDNFDGAGRKASDNNTLYLFAWLAI